MWMSFFFAGIWAVVAGFLFLWPVLFPGSPPRRIWRTDINLAWMAVFFSAYMVLRGLVQKWASRKGPRPAPPLQKSRDRGDRPA
jgi:hypothetical protein